MEVGKKKNKKSAKSRQRFKKNKSRHLSAKKNRRLKKTKNSSKVGKKFLKNIKHIQDVN